MTCSHYTPEFVTARMREREAGREPPCPHCRYDEAIELLGRWLDGECPSQDTEAFLTTTDSADARVPVGAPCPKCGYGWLDHNPGCPTVTVSGSANGE
jgi:hypothetical protein